MRFASLPCSPDFQLPRRRLASRHQISHRSAHNQPIELRAISTRAGKCHFSEPLRAHRYAGETLGSTGEEPMVAGEQTFEVRSAGIRRAWRAAGGLDDVWLDVECDLAFDDFAAAVLAVNEVSLRHSSVMGTMPAPTSKGHVVMLSGITDPVSLHAWLDGLAIELAQRVDRGLIKAAPAARIPDWIFGDRTLVTTAFLVFASDLDAVAADPERRAHWHVPPQATTEIAEYAVPWAREADGDLVVLRQNLYKLGLDATEVDLAVPLARAVNQTGMAGLEVLRRRHKDGRHVALSPGGDVIFQLYGDEQEWATTIAAIRPPLLDLSALLSYGCVRTSRRYALDISDIDAYPLPHVEEYQVRAGRHLLADYVPDAHGLQVLTERHLDRARNLADWQVTDLGHGRHLVAAPDLAPWFEAPAPDPDVLARARSDFGPMLLTSEVIAAHPPPWL